MTNQIESDQAAQELWRRFLTEGELAAIWPYASWTRPISIAYRRLLGLLPARHRCKVCNAPFSGVGGSAMKAVGKGPSTLNPRFCAECEDFARKYQTGAEIELSMLFADVRGSTRLAEGLGTAEFSQLINRFYRASTDVLVNSDALIDKLIGDEVAAFYVPGFAGRQHARRALDAAVELLRVTGHSDADGPWIPVGVGVHTGVAYVGAVGSAEGMTDITALGDAVNTAARLASEAGPGEILVSEATCAAATLDMDGYEQRCLDLKGRSDTIEVRVIKVTSA
jgi:adenylate cyclase